MASRVVGVRLCEEELTGSEVARASALAATLSRYFAVFVRELSGSVFDWSLSDVNGGFAGLRR